MPNARAARFAAVRFARPRLPVRASPPAKRFTKEKVQLSAVVLDSAAWGEVPMGQGEDGKIKGVRAWPVPERQSQAIQKSAACLRYSSHPVKQRLVMIGFRGSGSGKVRVAAPLLQDFCHKILPRFLQRPRL